MIVETDILTADRVLRQRPYKEMGGYFCTVSTPEGYVEVMVRDGSLGWGKQTIVSFIKDGKNYIMRYNKAYQYQYLATLARKIVAFANEGQKINEE